MLTQSVSEIFNDDVRCVRNYLNFIKLLVKYSYGYTFHLKTSKYKCHSNIIMKPSKVSVKSKSLGP